MIPVGYNSHADACVYARRITVTLPYQFLPFVFLWQAISQIQPSYILVKTASRTNNQVITLCDIVQAVFVINMEKRSAADSLARVK